MSEQTIARVMDKVRKLLALSQSANENEAAAAAAKAQAILAEHNLTMLDVKDEDAKPAEYIIDDSERTDSVQWPRWIASMAARMYFCKHYTMFDYEQTSRRSNGYIRHDIHHFVGEKHNVTVAKMMFQYLTATVRRLANEAAMDQPTQGRASYRNSFMKGCATGLRRRMHERIEAAKRGEMMSESGKNLPALLDLYKQTEANLTAFLAADGIRLSKQKRTGKTTNRLGMIDGLQAAERISLDQQVGGAQGHKRLT